MGILAINKSILCTFKLSFYMEQVTISVNVKLPVIYCFQGICPKH